MVVLIVRQTRMRIPIEDANFTRSTRVGSFLKNRNNTALSSSSRTDGFEPSNVGAAPTDAANIALSSNRQETGF